MQRRVDAERASRVLHGSFIKGRQIEVNLATPRKFTGKSPTKRVLSPIKESPLSLSSPNLASAFAYQNPMMSSSQTLASP
jgi:hypothetical protein